MAAVTKERQVETKGTVYTIAYPVKSGETIYKGSLAAVEVASGLLVNLTSGNVAGVNRVVVVEDDTANTDGPAATTAAGSISGEREYASEVAGDKTIRRCITKGIVKWSGLTVAQTDVGKILYAHNNNDVDTVATAGVAIGTLTQYIDSTTGYISLNFEGSVNSIV